LGALARAAANMKLELPADAALDAEVDLRSIDGSFFLQARLNASLPGLARDVAQSLMEAAHQICPYSKATRGNIEVQLNVL
jgi:Ohr subfamily peroxiredoxin